MRRPCSAENLAERRKRALLLSGEEEEEEEEEEEGEEEGEEEELMVTASAGAAVARRFRPGAGLGLGVWLLLLKTFPSCLEPENAAPGSWRSTACWTRPASFCHHELSIFRIARRPSATSLRYPLKSLLCCAACQASRLRRAMALSSSEFARCHSGRRICSGVPTSSSATFRSFLAKSAYVSSSASSPACAAELADAVAAFEEAAELAEADRSEILAEMGRCKYR